MSLHPWSWLSSTWLHGWIIDGSKWPLQSAGADIDDPAGSKITHLQSSEVDLSTFQSCWHLTCVLSTVGSVGKVPCRFNKESCPSPTLIDFRLKVLTPLSYRGSLFYRFYFISAPLMLLQRLMFYWVADWGSASSSSGSTYCRLRVFFCSHRKR